MGIFVRVVSIFLVVFSVIGCGAYREPDIFIRTQAYYDARATSGDLTLALDPYVTQGKRTILFNYKAAKRGIYPLHLIFFNESGKTYDLSGARAELIDRVGDHYLALPADKAQALVSRSAVARSAKFGAVGTLLGAPGIVTAPITALSGIVWGGLDTQKSNQFSKEVILEKGLKESKILPQSIVHGFLFFSPCEGLKGDAIMEKLKQPYQFQITGIKDEAGESVNFLIYIPAIESVKFSA